MNEESSPPGVASPSPPPGQWSPAPDGPMFPDRVMFVHFHLLPAGVALNMLNMHNPTAKLNISKWMRIT